MAERILLGALCGLMTLSVWATHRDLDLAVSPPIVVTHAKGPPCYTLHANVPLLEVDSTSMRLRVTTPDGEETTLTPTRVFADRCGEVVAKFESEKLREAVAGALEATLVLEIQRLDGTWFSAARVLPVITSQHHRQWHPGSE